MLSCTCDCLKPGVSRFAKLSAATVSIVSDARMPDNAVCEIVDNDMFAPFAQKNPNANIKYTSQNGPWMERFADLPRSRPKPGRN